MNFATNHVETLSLSIEPITLWRGEIDGNPRALAKALQPLADAGLRLQVFMRYRHFRDEKRAVVEVCPYTAEEERHCSVAMQAAGLTVSTVPALLLEGAPGADFEYRFADLVAEHDLRLMFCVTQTVNDHWMALVGFESAVDAEKAAVALRLMNSNVPLDSPEQEHIGQSSSNGRIKNSRL